MMKFLKYLTLCLFALVACEQLPDEVKIYGIGCKVDEVELGVNAGEFSLPVFADGEFTAALNNDDAWIWFTENPETRTLSADGDMELKLSYDINKGLTRSGVLTLTRGTNVFEVTFVQEGILKGGVIIEQKNITLTAEGGRYGVKAMTKLKNDDVSFNVEYKESDSKDWVTDLSLENNFISFSLKANLMDTLIRHAVVTVSFDGGEDSFQISQLYEGCRTESVDVLELKSMFKEEGEHKIDRHIVLEGIVINDHLEKNGAENRMISVDNQDLNYAERILYVQNADGSGGIKLIFSQSCAEMVARFDSIKVDLYGLELKRESEPLRYSISNIPVTAIVSTKPAEALAGNEKPWEDLTDDDLYTLVTVSDIEIPVRKGNYAPVDIRKISYMVSYPMVIRSSSGHTGHMMVNVDCPWSRDGKELPEGSGSVTGVIVHETCDNFEWDAEKAKGLSSQGLHDDYVTGTGRLGDYQIRPLRKSDIRIADEAETGFSEVLCEWAYCDSLGVNLVQNYQEQTLYPTYYDERLVVDATKFYCMNSDGKIPLRLCNDFTHLGPYTFGGSITDPSNGNGIYDAQGRSAHWDVYGSTGSIGVIYSYYASNGKNRWSAESNSGDGSNGSAWCVPDWVRYKKNPKTDKDEIDTSYEQYWCAEFSTKDLTAANGPLNLTFGTMNHIEQVGAPRFWKVQWKLEGGQWQDVCDYSVPDFVNPKGPRVYQLPGTKYITVNLPDAMLSAEKVYVRLLPNKDKLLAGTTTSYSDDKTPVASRYNAINYFAIRYNK